ncbi:hypothetical protein LL06_14810 [Hoeflea sp. BAL378]|uniref:hypothetical protein n=1 Tax=Hoeflea sp. BAL378 TaxID=1547437 RepID=UPI0005142D4A|nr:hypothetical protein [Hoeflea sp. BAL378]KGF68795.1 hypothetical protein LL06_14810 [Hoeflea sp. BAL378]
MSRIKTTLIVLPFVLAGCVSEPASRPEPRTPAVDLDAVLPPQSLLREDTVAALAHDRNESRLAYVGVWATHGDKCAMMDQTAFEGFAVITPDSIRQSTGTCSFEPGAPGETNVSFNATCESGRKRTNRLISVQMLNAETLALGTMPDQPAVPMVRCRLQE